MVKGIVVSDVVTSLLQKKQNSCIKNASLCQFDEVKYMLKAFNDIQYVLIYSKVKSINKILYVVGEIYPVTQKLFIPIFVVLEDLSFDILHPNKITVVLPSDETTYKTLLFLFKAGVDGIDRNVENLSFKMSKVLQFYRALKHITLYKDRTKKDHSSTVHYDYIIQVAHLVEAYDGYTSSHINEMGRMAFDIARKLGYSKENSKIIARATKMHDVGKISVPKTLLGSNVVVSNYDSWSIFHNHVRYGRYFITKHIQYMDGYHRESASLGSSIALLHHENCDGSGYPGGLKYHELPVEAKIVRVLDMYSSLIHCRPFRKKLTPVQTLNYIEDNLHMFDAEIVRILREIVYTTVINPKNVQPSLSPQI